MDRHETPPEPPIHRAARLGDLDELERLLARGEDIDSRADFDYDCGSCLRQLTPLMVAASSEDGATAATLRRLLGHGAEPRARSASILYLLVPHPCGQVMPGVGRRRVITKHTTVE